MLVSQGFPSVELQGVLWKRDLFCLWCAAVEEFLDMVCVAFCDNVPNRRRQSSFPNLSCHEDESEKNKRLYVKRGGTARWMRKQDVSWGVNTWCCCCHCSSVLAEFRVYYNTWESGVVCYDFRLDHSYVGHGILFWAYWMCVTCLKLASRVSIF